MRPLLIVGRWDSVKPPQPGTVVLFDIDGTLSILGDRLNCIKCDKPDYATFFDRCGEDLPNQSVVDLCKTLATKFDIRYATGRPERTRYTTLAWLRNNGLPCESYRLKMRGDDDNRADDIIKPELIADIKSSIVMVFEDRASVVQQWRSMGLVCCQVADGDF